ncbi:MAG: ATP synthase F1 subunit delta [Myxococcota bacterium]
MSGHPVAKRYAHALLELGTERSNTDALREQLDGLAELYADSKVFRTSMLNPSVQLEERRNTVRAIAEKLELDDIVKNFCLLLLDNDRFGVLPHIAEVFGKMVDDRSGNIRATITSASELDDEQVDQIKKALSAVTGKNVFVEKAVDESLLGGVVARVGGRVYDGSVRSQLESLRESILREV